VYTRTVDRNANKRQTFPDGAAVTMRRSLHGPMSSRFQPTCGIWRNKKGTNDRCRRSVTNSCCA